MIEKRFFLSNLLKTHFSFTFAISQNSKRALFVQNNPQKTEKKLDVFKYSRRYGIYYKEILMRVIYSFVVINLNKIEHFFCIRIILAMKDLLPANTYCKLFIEKLEQI